MAHVSSLIHSIFLHILRNVNEFREGLQKMQRRCDEEEGKFEVLNPQALKQMAQQIEMFVTEQQSIYPLQ